MHNGNGSGDVAIHMGVVPGVAVSDGFVMTEVAGATPHIQAYRPRREDWMVEIDGTTIEIRPRGTTGHEPG